MADGDYAFKENVDVDGCDDDDDDVDDFIMLKLNGKCSGFIQSNGSWQKLNEHFQLVLVGDWRHFGSSILGILIVRYNPI